MEKDRSRKNLSLVFDRFYRISRLHYFVVEQYLLRLRQPQLGWNDEKYLDSSLHLLQPILFFVLLRADFYQTLRTSHRHAWLNINRKRLSKSIYGVFALLQALYVVIRVPLTSEIRHPPENALRRT